MENVRFTDAGTVIFLNKTEMTLSEFYTFFEKGVKSYKITNCTYEIDKNIYSFNYKEKVNDYYQRCNICFDNNNFSSMPENLRILLMLLELEENLRRQKQYEELILKNKEKMLEDARKGIIKTEEARQLYMDELKNNLTIRGFFKRSKIVSQSAKDEATCWDGLILLLNFSLLFLMVVLVFVFVDAQKYLLVGIFGFLSLYELGTVIVNAKGITLIKYILGLMKGIKRDIVRENKLFRYKIKYLKGCNMSFGTDISKIKINSLNELTSKRINELFVKLARLRIDDSSIKRKEFVLKLDEYKKKMESIISGNLSLEEEQAIDKEFLSYLLEFEKEIDILLDKVEEEKKSYAFTGNGRGMVIGSDNVKTRRKEMKI